MAAGSNVIEFRIVQTIAPNGQVAGQRLQVRTKDVIVAVLGVSLGVWSDWQDVSLEILREQT